MILPLAIPGVVAGSIFTFSLTLGDYIIPQIIGTSRCSSARRSTAPGHGRQHPARGRLHGGADRVMASTSGGRQAHGGVRCALTPRAGAARPEDRRPAGLAFLHLPIALIFLYAFTTEERSYQSSRRRADHALVRGRLEPRRRLAGAVAVGQVAAIAPRSRWCSARCARRRWRAPLLRPRGDLAPVILPIALPGIITGIALRSAFSLLEIPFSFWTIVLGHATFCMVVVYNNAVARFRRTSGSLIEASMDLGANGFQTFRHVVLPNLGTALLAGGMLAFALSFDEVIVTTFTAGQQTTLPIWMLRSWSARASAR